MQQNELQTNVKKTLKKALALLRKGWTKGSLCKDKDKIPVDLNVGLKEKGCKFCSVGAIEAAAVSVVSPEDYDAVVFGAKQKLREVLPHCSIVCWNDAPDRRKPEVIATFQVAIKSLD